METVVIEKGSSRVEVLSDSEALSHKAAETFVNGSKKSVAERGRFAAAISGGSTPTRLYTLLGTSAYRDRVDWQHVHLFWVDERCVPKEHEKSNFRIAFDALLSRAPVPDGNIHRIKGEEVPEKAARDYERVMRRFFGISWMPMFDLVILGVGKDGHTASLFPGSKSLEETARLAVPVYLDEPDLNRVTLTLPVLNHAFQIVFLVTGRSKADILSAILEDEEKKKRFPAGLVRPVEGSLTWLIDRDAAEKLNRNDA